MAVLYSQIRSELKTGDLIAWNTSEIDSVFGLVLYLYQKILKANYTHVGMVVRTGGRVFLLEATPPQVRLIPLRMTSDFHWIKTDVKADPELQINFLLGHLGKKYSILDLIKILLKLGRSNDDYYCSELAGRFYNEFGFITDRQIGFTPDSLVKAVLDRTQGAPVEVCLDKANLQ